jgi:hypothetical protein
MRLSGCPGVVGSSELGEKRSRTILARTFVGDLAVCSEVRCLTIAPRFLA